MAPVKKSKKSKFGSHWAAANTLPLVIAVSLCWRESKEEWFNPAGGDRGGPLASSIHCYPYTQEHKKGC